MKQHALPEPPPDWGTDELTRFMDTAGANTYATFHNLRPQYRKLSEIDAAFRQTIDSLSNTQELLPAFFVIQAHSAFLGAVRLALSGAVSETYACLRLTLENALYGFYVFKNPGSGETWLCRHENPGARKKVRDEFKIGTFLKTLKTCDDAEGCVIETLYNGTIDYGAHPNERSLIQKFKIFEGEGKTEFHTAYLVKGDSPSSLLALKTTAQVGASVLGVFRLIYRERFDLIGLTDTIHRLRRGL